jgi:hypothetical protein
VQRRCGYGKTINEMAYAGEYTLLNDEEVQSYLAYLQTGYVCLHNRTGSLGSKLAKQLLTHEGVRML